MANRLELEITAKDSTAAGVASAKRNVASVEQEAARSAQQASRGLPNRDEMGRFMAGAAREASGLAGAMGGVAGQSQKADKELARLGRSVGNFERQATMYGKSGIELFRARADILRKTAGENVDAIRRIDAAQAAAEAADSRRTEGFVSRAAKMVAVFAAIKAVAYGPAEYAARTETLKVVTDQLAITNGYKPEDVRRQVALTRMQGITTQEANSSVQRLMAAGLAPDKAPRLARLAQDAGVIAGVSSADALEGITHGIVTRQTDVLRTYGIIVDFEAAYARATRERGHELSAAEKVQVAYNTVMEQGARIAGSYEAAMGTTGKQFTSLTRYINEAKNALGERLIPAFGTVVQGLMTLSGHVQAHAGGYSFLIGALTAAAAGFLAFKAAAGLASLAGLTLNPVLGGVAAAFAIAGAAAILMRDKFAVQRDGIQSHITSLDQQRESIKLLGLSAEDTAKQLAELDQRKEAALRAKERLGLQEVIEKKGETFSQVEVASSLYGRPVTRLVRTLDQNKVVAAQARLSALDAEDLKKGQEATAKRKAEEAKNAAEVAGKTQAKAIQQAEKESHRAIIAAFNDNLKDWDKLRAEKIAKLEMYQDAGTLTPKVSANVDKEFAMRGYRLLAKQQMDRKEKDAKEAMEQLHSNLEAFETSRVAGVHSGLEVGDKRQQFQSQLREDEIQQAQTANERRKDLELISLGEIHAQTTAAKIAVEEAKLGIELGYIERSKKLALDKVAYERRIATEELDRNSPDLNSEAYRQARAALDEKYNRAAGSATGDADFAREKATRETAIRRSQIQIDENRRVFDSMKQQAGSLLDQMFSKTRNFGDAVKGVMKAAFLTPLKDAASNQIAAGMTRLLTGQNVSLQTATVTGTGPFAAIRRGMARLGFGAQPVFGGTGSIMEVKPVNNSVPVWIMGGGGGQQQQKSAVEVTHSIAGRGGATAAAAGGILAGLGGLFGGRGGATGGSVVSSTITDGLGNVIGGGSTTGLFGGSEGGNPMIFHALGGNSGAGSVGGAAGSSPAGMLGSLTGLAKSPMGWLTKLGNLGRGPTDMVGGKLGSIPGTAGAKMPGVGGAAGGAMLLGGAVLAADGWRRGGWGGAVEMGAGGALIGAKFGGPMGALIGGAIGFGIGAFKATWLKSAEDKAKEKIKSAYGLDVKDKGILRQIVGIAKESFGGNIETAIHSPQIRDMLELYAMSTGQTFGTQAKVRSASLTQTGSGLVQNAMYENGRALAFGGIGARTSADIIPGNPGGVGYATNYSSMPTQVNLTLSPQQTLDVFDGRTVQTIADNPRTVQAASNKAQQGNFGRREAAIQQLSPGLIVA